MHTNGPIHSSFHSSLQMQSFHILLNYTFVPKEAQCMAIFLLDRVSLSTGNLKGVWCHIHVHFLFIKYLLSGD